MTRTWLAVSMFCLSCASPPTPAVGASTVSRPRDSSPRAEGVTPSAASASPAAPSSAPVGSASSGAPVALPASSTHVVEQLLEAHVTFLITGEDGRMAVLADEGGAVVPHRFERGVWQKIPLPEAQRTTTAGSSLGIYFGRDNRPRLMGHREGSTGRRMVYLRHRDGAWQDQRGEIGSLASDGSQLFGVLGEADPELVCKVSGICLLKSRKGWKELAHSISPTAVVRVFGGKGYALTDTGVWRANDRGFDRVGPPASWKSPATGFWVGDDGAIAVAEPAASAIHRLEPGAAGWQIDTSPIVRPRDVAGPPDDRWICGDGGLARGDGRSFSRVGEATLRLSRWIPTSGPGGLAAGPSGVFAVRAAR